MSIELSDDRVKGVVENQHLKGDDFRRMIRKVGSGTFPNYLPMPARVEGTSLQGSIRALETLAQVSHENFDQKSFRR